MSDSESSTADLQPGAPASAEAERSGTPSRPRGRWLVLLALLIAIAAAVAAGLLWQRSEVVMREAARRLQQSDARVERLEAQVQQSQAQARELQSRSAVIESKLTEALGQQAQLERMYKDITLESVAAVLGDVETAVSLASQQLLVSGNVRGAIVALQDADARLQRINQPEALGLRRLIARDLDRLAAVPAVDVAGLALRLDTVADRIAELPLLADLPAGAVAAPATVASQTGGAAEDGAAGFSFSRLAQSGRKGWESLLGELSQLFRVNRVDQPVALLLAPEQRYFVRENLRLTLLSARLALLARIEPVFSGDLARAIDWLRTYYARDNRGVENTIAVLEQLRASRITADLPSLSETLAAVRAARVERESAN